MVLRTTPSGCAKTVPCAPPIPSAPSILTAYTTSPLDPYVSEEAYLPNHGTDGMYQDRPSPVYTARCLLLQKQGGSVAAARCARVCLCGGGGVTPCGGHIIHRVTHVSSSGCSLMAAGVRYDGPSVPGCSPMGVGVRYDGRRPPDCARYAAPSASIMTPTMASSPGVRYETPMASSPGVRYDARRPSEVAR